jgi:hypothetical protein
MGINGNVSSMNGMIFEGGRRVRSQFPNLTRRAISGCTLFLVSAALVAGSALSSLAAPAGRVPERLLVKPKHSVPESTLHSIFLANGARQTDTVRQTDVRILHVPESRLEHVLDSLKNNPNIEFAEPDYLYQPELIPNDTYYANEWHLPKISAPQAWDLVQGSSNIIIAILDTGVDGSHPELMGKMVAGYNFFDNNTNTSDVYNHGTPVAGVAAASGNNGLGVASLAWGCLIMPVRVSDTNGWASGVDIANGLTWAADQGARVANISFGASTDSTVRSAAQYFQSKGGVVTVSAGNDGIVVSDPDNPYVLTVSATDQNDLVPSWSTTGTNVDLSAPGVSILTTTRGGGYGWSTGTSVSAPIVAGVAALVLSVNPSLTGDQVQTILKQSADDFGPAGWDPSYGYGRVNAYKAVLAATGTPTNSAPSTAIVSPASGTIVSNTVTITVSATDVVSVTTIKCYLNGSCVATNSAVPAAFSWDTTSYSNGVYLLQAMAIDSMGNSGTSSVVSVTVQNPVPDTTPPTAQVLSPVAGATVSSVISINVSASDNVGVTKVEWYLDGSLAGSSTNASPAFSWDTTTSANASHTVQAKAYDATGNVGSSALISVSVQNVATNPPTATVSSPANGATVSSTTTVSVNGTDYTAVTNVEWYLDGTLAGSSASASASFSWDTTKSKNGSHTVQSKAYDAAGHVGNSAIVSVTVQNADTTPPTATLSLSPNSSSVSATVTVNVSGADNVGVTKVEWYLDGALAGSSATVSASFSWDTTQSANGAHSLLAKAYDAAGNVGTSASVTVTVQNAVSDTTPPTAAITSPANGSTLRAQTTKISVTASDNVGVTKVTLLIDGKTFGTSTTSNPSFNWSTGKIARGAHTLQAIAYDAAGNSGRSTVVTVYK